MIFYHIQSAGNARYVPALLAYIYDPTNYYLVCVDRARGSVPEDIRALASKVPNIGISFQDRVTWGGASQVDVMVRAMRYYMDLPGDCRFYVNLSDSDFPLWTQAEFRSRLLEKEREGRRVFLQSWKASPPEFIRWSGKTDRDIVVLRHRADVEFILDGELSWMFQSNLTSPTLNARIRAAISSSEFRQGKALYLQPLSDIQIAERTAMFERTGLHIGRQWIILHIDYIRKILTSEAFFRCANTLRDMFIPDEAVFQTSFFAMEQSEETLHLDNFRMWSGAVGSVADVNFEELRGRPAAFARKINLCDSRNILTWARDLFKFEISSFMEASGWAKDRLPY